jgi:hypothetical protein
MITPYCNFARVGEELLSRNIAPLLMPFPEGHGRVVRLTACRLVRDCTRESNARNSVDGAEPARNRSGALLGLPERTGVTIQSRNLTPDPVAIVPPRHRWRNDGG